MSELSEVQRDLGRVEGKLDTVLDVLKTYHKTNETRVNEIDARLQKTQQRQAWLSGFSSLVGFCGGWFLQRFTH